ncbi:hypothetical protein LG293_16065 (plasmid) [Citricoccus nitrophenolicus]
MSNPAAAFKAFAPKTITAWHAQRAEDRDAFTSKCEAYARRYGRDSMVYRRTGFADSYTAFAVGFTPDGIVPDGWRRDSKTGYILPAKRTEAGKAAAKDLADLTFKSYAPGLPQVAENESDPTTGEGFIGGFSIHKVGDDWYATMGFEPNTWTLEQIDSSLWEQVPLSLFHAAQELQAEMDRVSS